MLKSSCRDCSTKSLTDFAHYYLWLFSTLWWNTSHQLQCKIFYSIPPPPPYLLSASVMSPFHIFTFTSWKQLAVPILRKLKFFWFLSTNLAGVDRGWAQIKRKREMAALAFLSHLPYCTCQAIAFFLLCTIYEFIGIPNYVFPPPFFMSFIPPGRSDINKIGLMAYFLVHWLMLIFS